MSPPAEGNRGPRRWRDPDRATVLVEIDRGGTWLVYAYRVRSAAAPVGLAQGAIIEGDGDQGR